MTRISKKYSKLNYIRMVHVNRNDELRLPKIYIEYEKNDN